MTISRIRVFSTFIFFLFIIQPASAVLKEKNLESTLSVLRGELTTYYNELEQQSEDIQQQQKDMVQNLMEIFNEAAQNSLMLYSQKKEYIFDLTYACHEATEMYEQFQSQSLPFRVFIKKNAADIARYDSLISNLRQMPVMTLSDEAKTERNVCLTLAINIRKTLKENSEQMADYIVYYQHTEERLRQLNDYAQKRYSEIQSNIFINGGENYFKILKTFGQSFKNIESAVYKKYRTNNSRIQSQWAFKIILTLFGLIMLYGLVAIALSVAFIQFVLPKRFKTKSFKEKRICIILAASVVTLALILGLIRIMMPDQNFIIMASGLLVEYAWLLGVIFISLLLRLEGAQIKSAFRIYSPLIVVGFIVITFRIILIPNDLASLIFPPILLGCTIWQWDVIARHNKKISNSDRYYTYMSLIVLIVSVVFSWTGYTLLSVEALIWWLMQLTCILTITCISDWMKNWAERKGFSKKPITETWFYDFCRTVILPSLGVASIVIAIYWAADVFNLSNTTWTIFRTKFIDTKNFSASIYGLCQVVALYFLFAYINRTAKALLSLHLNKNNYANSASRNVLGRNVIQIAVWGLWVLIVLNILQVGNAWLLVISGGLSTGVGFASKDIIENIYYGISLMTGRVKIGDLIECDGYRGTVSSISYTSTLVDVIDGSVIAFQNSQLFTKNYKNLTKNHGYEADKIQIGVAYGTDLQKVKALLIENISKLPFLKKDKKVSVVVDSFADSSINLTIWVWLKVTTHYSDCGIIRECIYKTLNDNNIEIPFPQLDINQKQ
jgi:potassium efflux system protein